MSFDTLPNNKPRLCWGHRKSPSFHISDQGDKMKSKVKGLCDACATGANNFTVSMETRHGWASKTFSKSRYAQLATRLNHSSSLRLFDILVHHLFDACVLLLCNICLNFALIWKFTFCALWIHHNIVSSCRCFRTRILMIKEPKESVELNFSAKLQWSRSYIIGRYLETFRIFSYIREMFEVQGGNGMVTAGVR